MYDKSGNVVKTVGEDGKPVSMDALRGQVNSGILKTWNQETQQW
jgi:hypothetical protein